MPVDVALGQLCELCEEDRVVGDPEVEHQRGADGREELLRCQGDAASADDLLAALEEVEGLVGGVAEREELAAGDDDVGQLGEELLGFYEEKGKMNGFEGNFLKRENGFVIGVVVFYFVDRVNCRGR